MGGHYNILCYNLTGVQPRGVPCKIFFCKRKKLGPWEDFFTSSLYFYFLDHLLPDWLVQLVVGRGYSPFLFRRKIVIDTLKGHPTLPQPRVERPNFLCRIPEWWAAASVFSAEVPVFMGCWHYFFFLFYYVCIQVCVYMYIYMGCIYACICMCICMYVYFLVICLYQLLCYQLQICIYIYNYIYICCQKV